MTKQAIRQSMLQTATNPPSPAQAVNAEDSYERGPELGLPRVHGGLPVAVGGPALTCSLHRHLELGMESP